MGKRATHYEPNRDESDRTFCGTEGEFERQHLTSYTDHVTCKRCRKIMAREQSWRAKELERSKASAWDSFANRVKQIGMRWLTSVCTKACRCSLNSNPPPTFTYHAERLRSRANLFSRGN